MGGMDGTRVVKLASFARVTHLVQERERLLYALTRDVKIVFASYSYAASQVAIE